MKFGNHKNCFSYSRIFTVKRGVATKEDQARECHQTHGSILALRNYYRLGSRPVCIESLRDYKLNCRLGIKYRPKPQSVASGNEMSIYNPKVSRNHIYLFNWCENRLCWSIYASDWNSFHLKPKKIKRLTKHHYVISLAVQRFVQSRDLFYMV